MSRFFKQPFFVLNWALSIILFFTCISTYAQIPASIGATSTSMGSTSVCHINAFSLVNNTASTTRLSENSIAFYTNNNYLITDLFKHHLLFTFSLPNGAFGTAFSYQGFAEYAISTFSGAISKSVTNNSSIGLLLTYESITTSEKLNQHTYAACISWLQDITPNTRAGLVYNHDFGSEEDHGTIGILHKEEQWLINLDYQFSLAMTGHFNMGLGYQIHKDYSLRVGLAKNLTSPAFGFGINRKSTHINLGICYFQPLGFSPSLDLSYHF